MANISEIKVNGNLYNIKDTYARNGDYCNICLIWDGNSENLEAINIDELNTLYRVNDAIEMSNDQYLIGNSSNLHSFLMNQSSSSEEISEIAIMGLLPMMLGINLGPANPVSSSCNLQENNTFGQYCIYMFGSAAGPELETELRELANSGIQIGVNLNMRKIMYINAPYECTLNYLAQFVFGIEEPITIPAGLWFNKIFNEEVYIDTLYLASSILSKIMDNGLLILFNQMENGTLPLSLTINT